MNIYKKATPNQWHTYCLKTLKTYFPNLCTAIFLLRDSGFSTKTSKSFKIYSKALVAFYFQYKTQDTNQVLKCTILTTYNPHYPTTTKETTTIFFMHSKN